MNFIIFQNFVTNYDKFSINTIVIILLLLVIPTTIHCVYYLLTITTQGW